jgi:hypothetical protein
MRIETRPERREEPGAWAGFDALIQGLWGILLITAKHILSFI